MCVSFVRRTENMLKYLGPDIRVRNFFKKSSKLFASISATQCFLPFCLQQAIPTNPGSQCAPQTGLLLFPKGKGVSVVCGWVGNLSWFDVPGIWLLHSIQWFCQNSSLVLMRTLRGLRAFTTFPSGGSDCLLFVPRADSWAQGSPI